MKRHMLTISLVVLGLCVLAVSAAAQETEGNYDNFKVNYFANNGVAGAPDATVRIDNPGSFAATESGYGPGVSNRLLRRHTERARTRVQPRSAVLVRPASGQRPRRLQLRHW